MATGFDTAWVMSPPDIASAGLGSPGADEWAKFTGMPATHPLVGGPGYGPDQSGFQTDSGYGRVVDAAMPGGAPADTAHRGRFSDWRELFDPHSPMMWLLLLAMLGVSLVHVRLQGRVGGVRAGGSVG